MSTDSKNFLKNYEFWDKKHGSVKPEPGMIVADNELANLGHHFSWTFYIIKSVTNTGRVMVRQLSKERVNHSDDITNSHDYTMRYVVPTVQEDGKTKMLKCNYYEVFDKDTLTNFYDGGCVN